ncbi:MAG: CAP domain-containing protein [Saprospiraceae bacterium]|nr:CAP domain-containing protein [Saprospiraceae bacterium]
MEYLQQIKTEIFNITNEVRIEFRLQPLLYSNQLDRMGQIHTNEMYTHKFFLHDNKYCKKVESLEDRARYCNLAERYDMFGENLADYPAVGGTVLINLNVNLLNKPQPIISAMNLARNIIKGWYHSPGHRANLLSPYYSHVGFGLLLYPKVCYGMKVKYLLVTQNFGRAR